LSGTRGQGRLGLASRRSTSPGTLASPPATEKCNPLHKLRRLLHRIIKALRNLTLCSPCILTLVFSCSTNKCTIYFRNFWSLHPTYVALGGLVVSVLATGPKVRGFDPDRGRWIFKGAPEHHFLRRGSKAVGPMS
jgi:hypothetical protein